jgi:hypothetical protein
VKVVLSGGPHDGLAFELEDDKPDTIKMADSEYRQSARITARHFVFRYVKGSHGQAEA